MLKRILLLPLLSPLLATLVVGAVNPKPAVAVRVLTWTSPALPLGLWIAGASSLGAGLSAAGAALALQGGGPQILPRRSVRRRPEPESWAGFSPPAEERPRRAAPEREDWGAKTEPERPQTAWAGPSRGAADPAPTVSVPFRVIRRGKNNASATPPPAASSPDPDDWGSSSSEEW